jgi:hypothetical protein
VRAGTARGASRCRWRLGFAGGRAERGAVCYRSRWTDFRRGEIRWQEVRIRWPLVWIRSSSMREEKLVICRRFLELAEITATLDLVTCTPEPRRPANMRFSRTFRRHNPEYEAAWPGD